MRKLILFILLLIINSSCWAPRCPIESCRSRYEHQHDDIVSGVFSGHYTLIPRVHFLWDKQKGESNPDTKFQPGTKNSKKLKKKYPWERW